MHSFAPYAILRALIFLAHYPVNGGTSCNKPKE